MRARSRCGALESKAVFKRFSRPRSSDSGHRFHRVSALGLVVDSSHWFCRRSGWLFVLCVWRRLPDKRRVVSGSGGGLVFTMSEKRSSEDRVEGAPASKRRSVGSDTGGGSESTSRRRVALLAEAPVVERRALVVDVKAGPPSLG